MGHHLALDLRSIVETMVFDNLMWNSMIDNLFTNYQDPIQELVYRRFLLDRFHLMRDVRSKTLQW